MTAETFIISFESSSHIKFDYFLGISKQEDFHWPEIPLEKTREIDNEARISKKAEMKRKVNRNQKQITL